MNNFEKKNSVNLDKFFFILFIFIYLYFLFKNYSGNYKSVESFLFDRNLGLANYTNDYFLNNSLHDQISIIYKSIGYLNINLSNDNIGFLLYFIFTTLSLFYTFKIINKFFLKSNLQEIFLILIVMGYGLTIFVNGNKSSWITNHTAVQTFFVFCLKPIFLWFLFNKKTLGMTIISSIMFLIALKNSWFLMGVAGLYTLIYSRKNLIWIFLPLIILIYIASLSPPLDTNQKIFFFENILERDNSEAAFHMQPLPYLISLILSFPISFLLIKKIKIPNEIKNFLYVLLYVSIVNFTFFFFLAKFGVYFFPEPRLLVLSGTRALELYEYFFMISLLVSIFQSNLRYIFKILILIFLLNLVTKSPIAIFSAVLVILSILLIIFSKIKISVHLENKSICIFLFLLSLIPGIIYLSYAKFSNGVSVYSYKKIDKWTVNKLNKDNYRIENLISLRNCDDFILIDLDYSLTSNLISLKSSFNQGTHSNYFNKKVIIESRKRSKIISELTKNIADKSFVNDSLISELKNYNVFIILDNDQIKYFPKTLRVFNLKNNESIIDLSNKNSFKSICKNFT